MPFTIDKDRSEDYNEIINASEKKEKADISHLLTIAKSLTQKAGARHSSKDSSMVQRMHDLACELGAKCDPKKATQDFFSKPAMKNDNQ